MNIGLDFRRGLESLPGVLESVVARINTIWNREHNTDGSHSNIHAQTVTADEVITPLLSGTGEEGLTINTPLLNPPEPAPAQNFLNLQIGGETQWRLLSRGSTLGTLAPAVSAGRAIGSNGSDSGGFQVSQVILLPAGRVFASRHGIGGSVGINFDAGTLPYDSEIAFAESSGFTSGVKITFVGGDAILNLSNGDAGQIQFPATQNPSADLNTLDDYEEGLVTPLTSPNIAYAASALNFQKIGSWVYITGTVTFPATADPNQAQINSLPFTCENSGQARGGCVCPFNFSGFAVSLLVTNNTTSAAFFNPATGASVSNAAMSGVTVFFDFKYRATA